MNVVNQLFPVKTKRPSVFVDGGLYSLDKDKISNQPNNFICSDQNDNLIQPISDPTPYTNIDVDRSTKRGLLSQTPTLLNKKRDLLDRFDNNCG